MAKYSSSVGQFRLQVHARSKLCPTYKSRSSSFLRSASHLNLLPGTKAKDFIPQKAAMHFSPCSFLTSFKASKNRYPAELMVCIAPNTVCVAGLPRRSSEESWMSSSIREAPCKRLTTFLMTAVSSGDTLNQTFNASMTLSRIPLAGSESRYCEGALIVCKMISCQSQPSLVSEEGQDVPTSALNGGTSRTAAPACCVALSATIPLIEAQMR